MCVVGRGGWARFTPGCGSCASCLLFRRKVVRVYTSEGTGLRVTSSLRPQPRGSAGNANGEQGGRHANADMDARAYLQVAYASFTRTLRILSRIHQSNHQHVSPTISESSIIHHPSWRRARALTQSRMSSLKDTYPSRKRLVHVAVALHRSSSRVGLQRGDTEPVASAIQKAKRRVSRSRSATAQSLWSDFRSLMPHRRECLSSAPSCRRA